MKFSSGWPFRSVGGPVSPWVDGFLIHANKGQKGSIPGSAARKVSPSKLQIRNGRSPTQSAKAKVPESDSSNSSMKSRLVEMEETGGFSEVCWEALEVPRRPTDKEYFCPFCPRRWTFRVPGLTLVSSPGRWQLSSLKAQHKNFKFRRGKRNRSLTKFA